MEKYYVCHANFEKQVLLESGNGESIEVLLDKWIPNYPTNKVLHSVHEGEEDWRVSDLIDSELHGWR